MTDNEPVEMDNLDDFARELFTGKAVPKQEPEQDEEVPEDTPEDDTPESEETSSEENQETPEPAPKKKKTAQERIDEVVREKYEVQRAADAELATLRERLRLIEEATSKAVKEETPPQGATPATEVAPDPDALNADGTPVYALGQFDPQFNADWMRWNFRQEMAIKEAEQAKVAEERAQIDAQTAEFNRLREGWDVKVAETVKTIPDFVEKGQALEDTFQNLDPTYGTYLVQTLMEMEHGPEVLYYLANHVEEAQAIVALGARSATVALGRLEAQFTGKAAPAIKTSQAPTPPERLRGTGGKFEVSDDTDDLTSFERKFFNA